MDTHQNHGSEDKARNINPDEVNTEHPAKMLKAQKKIDIRESGLGREQGQMPADEHIEPGYNEINDDDVRDQQDSTTDWDAENSRTGRHK